MPGGGGGPRLTVHWMIGAGYLERDPRPLVSGEAAWALCAVKSRAARIHISNPDGVSGKDKIRSKAGRARRHPAQMVRRCEASTFRGLLRG